MRPGAPVALLKARAGPSCAGFTLVELMLTMLIGGVLIGALISFYIVQQRTASVQQDLAIIQQNLRAAVQMLTRDIRMAGYDPAGTDRFGFVDDTEFSNGVTLSEQVGSNGGQIAFTSDLDGDGGLDLEGDPGATVGSIEQIAYRLDANRLEKYSTTTGAVEWQTVAENIEGIEFRYQLADGGWTLTPTASDLANIRSVRVSILARATYPDQSFNNTFVYRTASGATFGSPFNDHFRRRLLAISISCRNATF